MNNFLKIALNNAKHLPTTLAGVGAFMALLPQNSAVQAAMGISPKVAAGITAIGAVGSALALIFGAGKTVPAAAPPPKG